MRRAAGADGSWLWLLLLTPVALAVSILVGALVAGAMM